MKNQSGDHTPKHYHSSLDRWQIQFKRRKQFFEGPPIIWSHWDEETSHDDASYFSTQTPLDLEANGAWGQKSARMSAAVATCLDNLMHDDQTGHS